MHDSNGAATPSPPASQDDCPSLDDFDYTLPPERIAQSPLSERDAARLLVLDRTNPEARCRHAHVRDLSDWLRSGDLLVLNATRVLPARLRGRRESGGAIEALLLQPLEAPSCGAEPGSRFRALVKLSGRLRSGIRMHFGAEKDGVDAVVESVAERGEVVLHFAPGPSPYSVGEPPLPPYIRRPAPEEADRERYQTVFARVPGAIAAPTAGLHFTEPLFERLERKGVLRSEVVLHVGPGTFRPLDDEALRSGSLHVEHFELPQATAEAIDSTRERGGRVVAVGTTSARVLEARANDSGGVVPGEGDTDLFLKPGSRFRVVDALLTNFHLPRSSLLLLVAAFAGRERTLSAYREALEKDYRFYSYGDAMLIL
jgi:S-adenosylmethionine:tRNA ribosyltransferase-isomerase